MPRELPRYSSSESVDSQNIVSAAPIYQSYSRLLDNVEKKSAYFNQKKSDELASERGALAGQEKDFHPVEGGKAAQQYNKAALQSNKYAATADVMTSINRYYNQAAQNVSEESIAHFRNQSLLHAEGLMGEVPPQTRAYLKPFYKYKTTVAEQRLQSSLLTKKKNDQFIEFKNNNNIHLNDMKEAFQAGHSEAAMTIAAGIEKTLDSLQNLGVSTSKVEGMRNDFHRKLTFFQATSHVQQLFESAPESLLAQDSQDIFGLKPHASNEENLKRVENSEKFIENWSKSKFVKQVYSPAQIAAAKNKLISQVHGYIAETGLNNREIRLKAKSWVDSTLNGSPPSATDMALMQKLMKPGDFPNFSHSISLAEESHSLTHQIKSMSLSTGNSILNSIEEKKKAAIKSGDPEAKAIWSASFNKSQKVLINKFQDPQLYVREMPAYQEAVSQYRQDPEHHTLASVMDKSFAIQHQWGIPDSQIKLMRNYDAKREAAILNGFKDNPSALIPRIEQIKAQSGSQRNFNIMIHQMKSFKKGGINPAISLLINVAESHENRSEVQNVAASLASTPQELKKMINHGQDNYKLLESQVAQKINQKFSSVLSQQNIFPESMADLIPAITNLAAYYKYKGMDTDEASQKAFEVSLDDHYNQASLNGSSFLIPKRDFNARSIDPLRAQGILKMKLDEAQKSNFVAPNFYQTAGRPESKDRIYTAAVRNHGYWKQKGSEGYVLCGPDGNYANIGTKDNPKYMVVKYSDIADDSSPANVQLSEKLASMKGNVSDNLQDFIKQTPKSSDDASFLEGIGKDKTLEILSKLIPRAPQRRPIFGKEE